jgi:hypothetical protein
MKVHNAMQIKAGAKAEHNKLGSVTQPIQFLPREEKDESWKGWNMDWLEWEGLKQIRRNARPILKNYKLAAGLIDRSDYIVEEDNDYKDLVDQLSSQDTPEALELKFYPIIPNVIDVLVAEFAKRNKRISFRSMDEYSYNEIIDQKTADIEQVLVQDAEQKLMMKMLEAGANPEDPEFQKKLQEGTTPEALSKLPEIDDFYSKSYLTLSEKWASKQHKIDEERFKMDELEERAFRDSLVCDREFWHFNMYEDDYDVELWNPALTFYHKSPDNRYVSEGNWVGRVDMMTIADVIDRYGARMTEDQMASLETVYPVRSAGYAVQGYQNDGAYYDGTRSHAWNTNPPSLAHRQFTSFRDNFTEQGGDIINWILGQSEDFFDLGSVNMLRVTTAYWKTQRKLGHLTKIHESGDVTTEIVDESYKVTDHPIYDTTLLQTKDARTLVFGEHIEWIWINQIMGGIKIGPNFPSFWGTDNPGGINPIYLGINGNSIAPLKFQFKGDNNLYGCKLPVEGRIFTDRNTKSISPVDRMKPFQIGYNIVNNQIADILVDEIGTVILMDHNALPQRSMDEDWGKHNYQKAYQVMKDFQIMPLDTSMTNTENPLNFQHFQTINLEQTQRILSRVQLANYFKGQCYENIGVAPQRMGQQLGQTPTATGTEQAVTGSYAQTEMMFVRHSDHLMPRVHQMRTDLAQFYQSTKPSIRLQMITSMDERANLELNGTDLLGRDINVYATAKANHRDILEKLQRMAVENNTMGASLYDLGDVMQADSLGTVNIALREIEAKANDKRQEDMAHAEQMKEMELQQRTKEEQMKNDQALRLQEMKDRTAVMVAEIRASGFGAMQDLNENNQSDFMDSMNEMRKTEQYQETVNLQKDKEVNKNMQFAQKQGLERDKMNLQREMKDKDLEIARENKNQYDNKKNSNDKKS